MIKYIWRHKTCNFILDILWYCYRFLLFRQKNASIFYCKRLSLEEKNCMCCIYKYGYCVTNYTLTQKELSLDGALMGSSAHNFTRLMIRRSIYRLAPGSLSFKPCPFSPSAYFWCWCWVSCCNPDPDHQPWRRVGVWHSQCWGVPGRHFYTEIPGSKIIQWRNN